MTVLQRFKDFILTNRLFSAKDTLLLAVSGGIDSVVLCELCKQAGFNFIIAHCNFQLRGEESERDKVFVQQLAQHYKVPLLVKDFDTRSYADTHKLSVQEAARELRYAWFEEVRGRKSEVGSRKPVVGSKKYEGRNRKKEAGSKKDEAGDQEQENRIIDELIDHSPFTIPIVTAHHLDDNIETMLMHFFRGTGIHGLRGMLPMQGHIVRPLLFASKTELLQFAAENKLQWVEDSSNLQDKYTRNYFRHHIIPLISKIFPEAEHNLAGNLRRFADLEILYEQAIAQHKKKLLEVRGAEIHIPFLKLKKARPLTTIIYEIIKDAGFSSHQTGEVISLLDSESGKYVQSATHRIIKNRNWLIIAPLQPGQSQHILIEAHDRVVQFAGGELHLQPLPATENRLPDAQHIACLDARHITYPLLLRKWKQGDYFYPLGMKKKKKLARFFIDQKLSLTDKEKVWVLEMNKKICWVVGMRIDDRFKITGKTQNVLRVQLKLV